MGSLLRVLAAFGVVCFGCSSSDSDGPAATSTGGAPADAQAGTGGSGGLPTCGPAPHVLEGGNSVLLLPDGTTTPIGGVRFSPTLCPGAPIVITPPDGRYQYLVSKGVPVSVLYEGDGILTQLRGEYSFQTDSDTGTPTMLRPEFVDILSDFGPDKSALFITVRAYGSGACAMLDGVSFGVTGHPEATITYYDESTPPTAIPGGTATSRSGYAAVAGLPADSTIEMTATKPGCNATMARPPRTGRALLMRGIVSMMSAAVEN